jgi:hypothetical protein
MEINDVIEQLADHINGNNIDNRPVDELLCMFFDLAAEEGRRRATAELCRGE